jgi:Protein of unknown function (DUF1572)
MTNHISNALWKFQYYKSLGEKAIAQLEDDQLNVQLNEDSNSIALIIKHLSGNMLSRWTDFLTSDGEKEWRNRDNEFEGEVDSKAEIMAMWEEGWQCLFNALENLTDDDLDTIVYIRNEGLTVLEAINRQLAHYPYHVGQIVFLAKALKTTAWNSLSVPRGQSQGYNQKRFEKSKARKDFDEGY